MITPRKTAATKFRSQKFKSPVSVGDHCDNKLRKDSKKNSVEKLWEPIFNDTEEEHSVESIHHEEFCSSDKETNNNGIMLAENKLKLEFSEISRKQHNCSKEKISRKTKLSKAKLFYHQIC